MNDSNGRPFQVGVITSHGHAGGHIKILDALPEVETIHVCGTTESADLEALAGESPKVGSTTRDMAELLGRPGLDAIALCMRPDLAPHGLEAAVAAGLPVLFDKPGAATASDLRAVAEHARERGVTVGGMLQWRYNPMVQEAYRARRDGALGRILGVESRMVTSQVRYRDPETSYLFRREAAGSGILSWLGCHIIDMVLYLMGERIVEVSAMLGNQNPEPIEVEDTGLLVFRFSDGAMGTLYAGYHLAGPERDVWDMFIGLRGADGYASLPLHSPGVPSSEDRSVIYSQAPTWVTGGRREQNFEIPEAPGYGGVMAEQLFSAFLRAGRAGELAPSPIEDAVHVLEIVEAAKESSETGHVVRIEG